MKSTVWRGCYLVWVCLWWMLHSIVGRFRRSRKTTHILFCSVDHYEPGTGGVPRHVEIERVERLLNDYPALADQHEDSAGNVPKRTWFVPPPYHRNGTLQKLVNLCDAGYGEIELHLHHGETAPDTSENLRTTIEQSLEEFGKLGIFGSDGERKRYGFIHGRWGLDNSLDGCCGVNDELIVLRDTGCYADFTLPSLTPADPWQINSVYYANDDPERPKSYSTGTPVRVGGSETGDLMIVLGPTYLFRMRRNQVKKGFFPFRVLGDLINAKYDTGPQRIAQWIRAGIHVQGKPEWVFVKTAMHGAPDHDVVTGETMDRIFTHLEAEYNDGVKYCLHYVTARELYNIIKAAEAAEPGDNPEAYRDYVVRAPEYQTAYQTEAADSELPSLVGSTCGAIELDECAPR